MQQRYQSADCCDKASDYPYVPILSHCKAVTSINRIEWNVTYLRLPATQSVFAPSLNISDPSSAFLRAYDIFRGYNGASLFSWFKNSRDKRVGFKSLIETFTGGTAAFGESWLEANALEYWPHDITDFGLRGVETAPSCEAYILNIAGDSGVIANMGFYAPLISEFHCTVITPSFDCSAMVPSGPPDWSTGVPIPAPLEELTFENAMSMIKSVFASNPNIKIDFFKQSENSAC